MNSAADLHTLTGAYAADALDDAERAQFEEHLALCPSCDQEVRELTATVARLALASAVAPRPALKDEVLRRIGTVRQDVPSVPQVTETGPGPRPRRARGIYRWALAACLAAVGLGGTAVWQHQRAEDAREQARQVQEQTREQSQELAAVLAAPDARTRTGGLTDGARGTVVVSKSLDKAVFVADGMARPPKGKVYQLWFDDGGSMRSAGLMDPDRSASTVLMRGGVGKATGMGITVEPAGGSDAPTSSPVALMELPV
ncbi:anti-sigma factor [Streptomyces venezuelae]|uniref:Regulator of SigK n=1 Tax=Streptomyces venezuelae TaxID=54571 RepID=A0A5P2CQF0_STRVZ|nr:anti-sigma factor [Streptomyces venezuelae]QES44633.1 anti-sigma factor [Streptomyces venezuelae]